ncbi:MAG TPA: hypothetical protein VHD63_03190, partial [Ktedonobacteraceae bacterium]|nr:hypothetical protein [Ktedonobacteraceae bacterium]
ALVVMNILWWTDTTPPLAFAFLGIVLFLAHCNFFYRSTPETRRQVTVGYGILAVLLFLSQLFFKRNLFSPTLNITQAEWPLLFCEFCFLIIGVAAFFYRPRQGPQTAQQARNAAINQTARPAGIARNIGLFRRLFPVRPPQHNPANNQPAQAPGAGQGNNRPFGNPDPGAP